MRSAGFLLLGLWMGLAPAPPAAALPPPAAPPEARIERVFLRVAHGGARGRRGPPDAAAYVPSRFDRRSPLSLVVYLHGHNNCAENVLRDEDGPCASGGAPRQAHDLMRQLDASGRSAILLVPETSFDRASGSPGPLAAPGGLRRLVEQALLQLAPRIGPRSVRSVRRVAVFAHSAGYQAAAAVLRRGGVPVHELYLLDALYGHDDEFAAWIRADLGSFRGPRPARRFATVYSGGRTRSRSEALARAAARWTGGRAAPGLLFMPAGVPHAEVPRRFFGWLLRYSGLPAVRHLARSYGALSPVGQDSGRNSPPR